MQVKLLGKDYVVAVQEYDSFGESAFNLKPKERRKKTGTAAFAIKCMVWRAGRCGSRFRPIFTMISAMASSILPSSISTVLGP